MTNKKWFLNLSNQVTGPFLKEEIERLTADNPTALIWGRGFSEWVPLSEWKIKIEAQAEEINSFTEPIDWKYRSEGIESHKMSFSELITLLKNAPQISRFDIWSSKSNQWKEIFSVEEVADELGISRRTHPRVPIMGTYTGESEHGPFECIVGTISEGGLGLSNAKGFKIGDHLKGLLISNNLPLQINCFCEVVYVGTDGYTGLRFSALPSEAQSMIIAYVKKFGDLA